MDIGKGRLSLQNKKKAGFSTIEKPAKN